MKKSNFRAEIKIIIFIMAACVLFALGIGINRHGDDSTYYSMVSSFLKDGDFILNNKDVLWWQDSELKNIPGCVYIFADSLGIMRYGKPILYPLIAAPFYFLRIKGLALLNGLLLGGGIVFAYLYLRKYFERSNSLILAVMFFFCSFIPVYVSWIDPEMFLFFSASLCMWLWLGEERIAPAALIMGIVSTVRLEFFLLFILLIVVLAFWKKFKDLRQAVVMFLSGYLFTLILTLFFFGQFSPYIGNTYFIPGKKGEPYLSLQEVRAALAGVRIMFESSEFNSWSLFFRNIANFFIGRYTGLIWYAFPAAVCAAIYLFQRRRVNREEKIFGDCALAAMLILALILIVSRPLNYFGGRGFICNRYFSILPLALFLPGLTRVKKPFVAALFFLPGLLISGQLIKDEILIEDATRSQSAHTFRFPLKYAPLEIAQVELLMLNDTSVKIADNLFLYILSAEKSKPGKGIFLNRDEELVIIQAKEVNDVTLITGTDRIILQPWIVLKNRLNKEAKSFYYFKTDKPLWIDDIQIHPAQQAGQLR